MTIWKNHKNLILTMVMGSVFGFSSVPALAQQGGKAAPATAAPAAPAAPAANTNQGVKVTLKAAAEQSEWLKVCGADPSIKKTICYTTRDFVAENNQPVLAVAIYSIKEDTRRFARFLVPLTFLIQPGVRFSVDGVQPVNAKFQICLPQGCFVEGELSEAFIAAMKKGNNLRIDMQNQLSQEVNFEAPLTGFSSSYDSAGIDEETLAKMQQQGASSASPDKGGAASEDLKKKGEELLRQRQQTPTKQ